jgi:hypothetical protein
MREYTQTRLGKHLSLWERKENRHMGREIFYQVDSVSMAVEAAKHCDENNAVASTYELTQMIREIDSLDDPALRAKHMAKVAGLAIYMTALSLAGNDVRTHRV